MRVSADVRVAAASSREVVKIIVGFKVKVVGVVRVNGGSLNDCDARVQEGIVVIGGIGQRFKRRDYFERERPRLQGIDLQIPNQDSAAFVFR